MTKRGRTQKTWYAGLLFLIGLGLIFVSCNSDDGGNPIAPQGDTQSDFIASQGQTDEWGTYYYEGDSSFYVNIPMAGDYQLAYAIINEAGYKGGPFYITLNTPEAAILEVGLKSGHILDYACMTSGTIDVTQETANTIKTSWKVTVFSVTSSDGSNVSWWTPEVQTIFTADPNGEEVCVIEDGARGDDIVEITPPSKGDGGNTGGGGGGTTRSITDVTFTWPTNHEMRINICDGTTSVATATVTNTTISTSFTTPNVGTTYTVMVNKVIGGGTGAPATISITAQGDTAPASNQTDNTCTNLGSTNNFRVGQIAFDALGDPTITVTCPGVDTGSAIVCN